MDVQLPIAAYLQRGLAARFLDQLALHLRNDSAQGVGQGQVAGIADQLEFQLDDHGAAFTGGQHLAGDGDQALIELMFEAAGTQVAEQGYQVTVCAGWEAARDAIQAYLEEAL